MQMQQIFIVQNRLTGEFLRPDGQGSVETAVQVNAAGWFYDYQAAIETALDEMEPDEMLIFGFYMPNHE